MDVRTILLGRGDRIVVLNEETGDVIAKLTLLAPEVATVDEIRNPSGAMVEINEGTDTVFYAPARPRVILLLPGENQDA